VNWRRAFVLFAGFAMLSVLPTCGGEPTVPTVVTSVRDAVSVALFGAATCVLHEGGTVDCWGEVDDTATVPSGPAPRRVGRAGVRQISTGGRKPCLLDDLGTVWCWGIGHEATPERVEGLGDVVQISEPAVAIEKTGDVFYYCVPGVCSTPPLLVPWAHGASRAAGVCAALATTTFPSGGHLQCETAPGDAPVSWFADRTVLALQSYGYNWYALLDDGSVLCAGDSTHYECGDYSGASAGLRQVPGIPPAVDLFDLWCAKARDGAVWCWGDPNGLPVAIDRAALDLCGDSKAPWSCTRPIEVPALRGAIQVARLGDNGCAIMSDNSLKCWGDNTYGQLGQ
jgi:hypothetical protein